MLSIVCYSLEWMDGNTLEGANKGYTSMPMKGTDKQILALVNNNFKKIQQEGTLISLKFGI
jgi:hypothetical protein